MIIVTIFNISIIIFGRILFLGSQLLSRKLTLNSLHIISVSSFGSISAAVDIHHCPNWVKVFR